MNHQPYETWILDDYQVTLEEKTKLDRHLADCPKCTRLARSWTAAKQEIKLAPVIAAPAGFSQRWQNSLAARRIELKRQQTRTMLISLISTAVAVSITLGVLLLPAISPITVMVNFFSGLIKLVNSVSQFWIFLSSFLKAAPTEMVIGLGLMLSLWVSITTLAWGISLYRITLKGIRTTK